MDGPLHCIKIRKTEIKKLLCLPLSGHEGSLIRNLGRARFGKKLFFSR
jgi:hypothetical protein